jgi:acetoin utilization protein AcuB
MSKDLITVRPTDSLERAHILLVKHSVRHLPVTSDSGLIGIITESDIRGAFIKQGRKTKNGKPTVLDPAKMKVTDHMTRTLLTVAPETCIEDAALMIYKHKIGALPVVKAKKLVGIISIMDILGLFVDMMGMIHASSRIDVVMNKASKNFDKVSNIFHQHDIDIISVGMAPYPKDAGKQIYYFRIDLCKTGALVKEIEKAGFKVLAALE